MVVLQNLPMPPSVNAYYATVKIAGKFRRIKSREANDYERAMTAWAMTSLDSIKTAKAYCKQLKPGVFMAMDIDFFFHHKKIISKKGTPKRNDTSNRLKALHDQLCAILQIDDCWVFDGSFKKRICKETLPEVCQVRLELVVLPDMLYNR